MDKGKVKLETIGFLVKASLFELMY